MDQMRGFQACGTATQRLLGRRARPAPVRLARSSRSALEVAAGSAAKSVRDDNSAAAEGLCHAESCPHMLSSAQRTRPT